MIDTKENMISEQSNLSTKETKSSAQFARQLQQLFETEVGGFFAEIAKIPIENLCKILIELPSDIFEEAFSRIPHKKMAIALSYLASDNLTDFLQRVKQYDQDYAKST